MSKHRSLLAIFRDRKWAIANRLIAIAAMHGLCANAYAANVLPTGGQYVAGNGAISTATKGVVVNQSSKTGIVNWQGFSIGSGNSVQFNNGTGATLNRVTGGSLSQIDGMLKATGSVYLINPQGVVVGAGGKIVTNGSFVASTRDVNDSDFMNGKGLHATGTSSGAVVNKGTITSLYGDTILVGGSVNNSGSISAPNGTAGLATGNDVVLRPAGSDPRISVSAGKGDVTNTGTIAAAQAELAAAGGNVYALAGNNGGLISATGTKTVDGHVWLSGGGTTEISGTVKAVNANGTGGTIVATGKNVQIDAAAHISASGATGGTVLIGGDQKGGSDPSSKHVSATVANAQTTTVANGAQISADGTQEAGGAVVIWSDDHTIFDGKVSATGMNGNGGDAEVSGHDILDFTGLADLSSRYADIGNLLLDPRNVTINNNTTSGISQSGSNFTPSANNSVLNVSTLTNALRTANITVTTGTSGSQAGTIAVSTAINWTQATTLTLKAASSITIGAAITNPNGGLNINAGSSVTDTDTINVKNFTLTSGNWSQIAASLPSFTAGNFVLTGGTFLRVKSGDGTAATPYQIADIYGLQGMIGFTGSSYSLANDIDASTTSGWNGGAGFVSLTLDDGQTFDGQNHSINGLVINTSGWGIGLFGYNYGTIQNLTLHGGSVTDGGGIGAGALAGGNYGTISNVHSDLAVGGADGSDNTNYLQQAGGLVGYNTATGIISNSSASGNVSGYNQLGGLVGNNYGQITNSSASGSVTPGALYYTSADAGGLVGRNEGGTIDGGVASGDVIGQLVAGYTNLGGLVGTNVGTIKNSHASGNVTGDATAGGLVGSNGGYSNGVPATGSIDNSYYELGTVTGYDDTGGLVGANGDYSSVYGGAVTNSYVASTATVTGTRDAGGLVGSNYDTGTVSGSHSAAMVNADVGNSGDQIYEIGGLTGRNGGSVTDSYATGAVNAGNESYYIGGLTGSSYGTMTNVYATGAVAGGSYVGGLAGDVGGTITTAHATGAVTVYSGTGGGFAGIVDGSVNDAYATGDVTAADASLTAYGYSAGGLGGFVSINNGTISNAYASGNVTAGDGSDGVNYGSSVGGFAASNNGTITLSHATGKVTGFMDVGGFAGSNGGTISQSYATGKVTSGLWYGEPIGAGGFAGENSGGITLSYATGDVSSPSNDPSGAYDFGVGGLVGYNNSGTISQSYATGNASGTLAVGGLVGYMQGGSVTDAYATGSVTGLGMVGGLIGENELATITNTYATGAVSGSYDTGALVGANGEYGDSYSGYGPGTITNSYWETDTAGGLPGVGYDTGFSTSVTGLSAAQMQDSSNFVGFDFNNIWSPAGNGYAPELYGVSYVVRVDTAGSYQYGDPIQSTFYGLQNGDLSSIITGLITTTNAPGTPQVGQVYQGSASGATATSNSGVAYRFIYNNGDITITPREITVQADAASKTYGQTDPNFTYQVTGGSLLSGDSIIGALSRDAGNNAGSYNITQGSLAINSNYTIDFLGATFTINPATLTYAADAASRTYGSSNPTFTGSVTGFVNGDTLQNATTGALSFTSPTTASSNAGSYAINGGGLFANNGNYVFVQAAGNATALTINKAMLTFTAAPTTRTYGSSTPALSGNVTGYVLNQTQSNVFSSVSWTSSGTNAGTWAVTGNGSFKSGMGSNYTIVQAASNNTALTIDPLTIGWSIGSNGSATYGTVGSLSTVTLTGVLTADRNYVKGIAGLFDGLGNPVPYVSTTDAATYTEGAASLTGGSSGDRSGNYVLASTGTTKTFTINPKQITYSVANASGTYGTIATLGAATLNGVLGADSGLVGGTVGLFSGSTPVTYVFNTAAGTYTEKVTGLTGTRAGNYALSSSNNANGTFTINKAILTYSTADAGSTYGTLGTLGTITFSGLVPGDGSSVTGTEALYSGVTPVSYVFNTNAGTYQEKVTGISGTGSSNYTLSSSNNAPGTFTITPLAITLTANSASKTYGDGAPGYSYAISGNSLVGSDAIGSVAISSPGDFVAANAGQYDIGIANAVFSSGRASNYDITYATLADGLTVNARPITLTGDLLTRIYGDANPATSTASVTSGNLVNGDTISSVDVLGSTASVTSNVGNGYSYSIGNAGFSSGQASNYDITYLDGGLTIDARAITLTGNAASKTYGDAAPAYSYTISSGNLVNNDELGSVDMASLGDAVTANKGQYDIVTSNAVFSSGLASNYAITYGTLTNGLTVTARAITVTGDAASKVYGDGAPAYGFAVTSGNLVNSDTIGSVDISSNGDAVTAGVGRYDITAANAAFSAGQASNYAITYGTLTDGLTVTARPITITGNAASKVYGDGAPAYGYTVSSGNLVNGDTLGSVDVSSTGDAVTANVGQYDVNAANAAFASGLASNYDISYGTLTNGLTVTARALTITGDLLTRIYGDANPATWTASGDNLANGDTISSVDVVSSTASANSNVGSGYSYSIGNAVFSSGLTSNYAITYADGSLTIDVRPITVTADVQSKVYGDTNPPLTFTTSDLGAGASVVGSLDTAADSTSGVGAYGITQGTVTNANNSNYDISYQGADLTITARPITVTADAQNRIYGDANPALTYVISNGNLVNGDTLNGGLFTAANSASGVGDYAIAQGTLAASANYTLTYVGGTLTISPRAITITADNQSRIYGDANPALTYGITSGNLVNGDVFAGGLTTLATLTSDVGNYAITQGSLAASPNYAVTYVGGALSVTPRAITVTADDLSRIYGSANPLLTYVVGGKGLVNSDTLTGTLATPAGTQSNIGNYAITQGSLASSSNYVLTFVPGTLAITPAALLIAANDSSALTLGQAQPTASYIGLVAGDTSAVVTGLQLGLFPITGNAFGYDIVPFGASAQNYAISYQAGLLTLTAQPPGGFTSPVTPGGPLGTLPSLVLVTGSSTFNFSNVATAAIGGDNSIVLFDVGLPGEIGSFNQFVITDYSNATNDDDRLVAAQ